MYSTFGVVTTTVDGRACAEDRRRERRQARRVDVLDDLHQHRRVEAAQPVVAVGQRGLQQRDPAALTLGQPVQAQPALGEPSARGRDVDPDDLGVALVPDQVGEQRTGAAAEVEHPGRAGLGQRGQDGSRRCSASGSAARRTGSSASSSVVGAGVRRPRRVGQPPRPGGRARPLASARRWAR